MVLISSFFVMFCCASNTVASDNTVQKVPIAAYQLPSTCKYLITPKIQPVAYLTARVKSNHNSPPFMGILKRCYLDWLTSVSKFCYVWGQHFLFLFRLVL